MATNGHVPEPTELDRSLVSHVAGALEMAKLQIQRLSSLSQSEHLHLESHMAQVGWIYAHVVEALKEVDNIKQEIGGSEDGTQDDTISN